MQPNETSAQNVKGFILRGMDGELFFRIYDEKDRSKYKDYKIDHYDLEVQIIDNYSSFYEYDEKKKEKEGFDGCLDYPSRILKGGTKCVAAEGRVQDQQQEGAKADD